MDMIRTLHLWHRFERKNDQGEMTAAVDALKDVSIGIEKGSFVAVVGHNGSGKSTMARHLNALLLPTSGTVIVDGMPTDDPGQTLAVRQKAGMVFQNPDNQIIADVVEEDVGFGPENLGVPTENIWKRVAMALEKAGIQQCRQLSPRRLSGGQKQRVAIAGILAMKPSCMILDEPTAMLDPAGRRSVMEAVRDLNRLEGITIILITHDMEEAALADRIIVMDQGRPVMDGSPDQVFADPNGLKALGLSLPPALQISWLLQQKDFPLQNNWWKAGLAAPEAAPSESKVTMETEHLKDGTVMNSVRLADAVAGAFTGALIGNLRDLDLSSQDFSSGNISSKDLSAEDRRSMHLSAADVSTETHLDVNRSGRCHDKGLGEVILRLEHVSFSYGAGLSFETKALKDISVSIRAGRITGLIGPTGAGKSTLLQHLNGLLVPAEGRVYFKGVDIAGQGMPGGDLCRNVGMVFQYPEQQLFAEDVLSDVMFGPLNMGLSDERARESARQALSLMGIGENVYKKSPFELSGGQKRRAAIAGVLAMEPQVLVLDEPMAGLDQQGQEELVRLLLQLKEQRGTAIVWSSHSMEDMAKYADDLLVMNQGRIVKAGTPADVFADTDLLESIGLAAPASVYLLRELRKKGVLAEVCRAVTPEAAAGEIVKAWNRLSKQQLQQDAGSAFSEAQSPNGTLDDDGEDGANAVQMNGKAVFFVNHNGEEGNHA